MSAIAIRSESVPTTIRQQKEVLVQAGVGLEGLTSPHDLPSVIEHRERELLQVSPYIEPEHQLDLSSVDLPNRLFALALTELEPVTASYATTEYSKAFNWSQVLSRLQELATAKACFFPDTEFYVVEFRSKLKEEIDNQLLFTLDKQSHREATAAGGLLKYWYGHPDKERRNLATCLWRGKEDAIEGGKGLWHKQAREIIATTYESINVRGLRLVIGEGASKWKFEPWSFH